MQRYESYKDSGVAWLGEVPRHWEVKRHLGLFDERKEVNRPDMELLSVTINRGVIKQEEITKKKDSSNEDKSKYKVMRKDDLVYNKMRMWQGAIGQSAYDGIVSPAYVILKPRDQLYSRFFHYLFRTGSFIDEANRNSYGLCLDMNSLRYEDFKNIYSPVPPKTDVKRIVNFLDQKTAEIDAAIAKKEHLIELLKEQKSILINQAVTRGLNPNVPMKDSGVEWIGQIPAHWNLNRLKFLFTKMEQGWSPQCFNYEATAETWGVLKVGCVNHAVFIESENKQLPPELNPLIDYKIHVGDILISRANSIELVGSAALVKDITKNLLLCDKLYRVRPVLAKIIPEYMILLLRSTFARIWIQNGANGASPSMQNIGQDVIKNLVVPLPSLREQEDIIMKTSTIEKNQMQVEHTLLKEILLLNEFKKSIIANAVTGKFKV